MSGGVTERGNVLIGVDWERLFPWLVLFRTFKVAASGTVLFVATCGAIATPIGWRLLSPLKPVEVEQARQSEPAAAEPKSGPAAGRSARVPPAKSSLWRRHDFAAFPWQELPGRADLSQAREAIFEGPGQMARMPIRLALPWGTVLIERTDWRTIFYLGLGSLWTIAVWGFCGGVITRIAVVQLGRCERVGLMETIRFVIRRPAYFLSPLLPQVAFVVAIVVGMIAGVLMRLGVGVLLVGLLWPLVLIFGLLCTIITIGLAFGWPMMWCVASAEQNGDVFEATQRSYSYAWERPLRYLFYAAVAFLFGCLSWIVVRWFTLGVVHFSEWSVAWGASWDRMAQIEAANEGITSVGWRIASAWNALVVSVAVGFSYSYFWTAYSAIYLLLRHDIDERVPLDQIYMPDETERYELPPLTVEEETSSTEPKVEEVKESPVEDEAPTPEVPIADDVPAAEEPSDVVVVPDDDVEPSGVTESRDVAESDDESLPGSSEAQGLSREESLSRDEGASSEEGPDEEMPDEEGPGEEMSSSDHEEKPS